MVQLLQIKKQANSRLFNIFNLILISVLLIHKKAPLTGGLFYKKMKLFILLSLGKFLGFH